jgi:hypothetical protein
MMAGGRAHEEMRKYDPLQKHLITAPHPHVMTFDEIDRLVGGLPPTARERPQWWSNNAQGHVQAAAWLGCGRRVERADLERENVRFS